jgi:hypothetical protein
MRVGAAILCMYLVSLFVAFQALVSVLSTLAVLVFVPLAGLISMRSLGETDNRAGIAIGRCWPLTWSEENI